MMGATLTQAGATATETRVSTAPGSTLPGSTILLTTTRDASTVIITSTLPQQTLFYVNLNFASVDGFAYDDTRSEHFNIDKYHSSFYNYANTASLDDRFNRSYNSPWKHSHPHYYFGRLDDNFDQRDSADDHRPRPNQYGYS
jgi:hypothetical protein